MIRLKTHTTIKNTRSGKALFGAWLFIVLVLLTIIPFNLIHDHQEKGGLHEWEILQTESVNSNLLAAEAYGQCDHEIHIGKEQQICFLCHFAFAPNAPTTSLSLSSVLVTPVLILFSDDYVGNFTSQPLGVALNKGPPTTLITTA